MSEPIKIGVVGANGRMGRLLVAAVAAAPDMTLSGATGRPGSTCVGKDAGTLAGIEAQGVTLSDDPTQTFVDSDVTIDFTTPEATRRHGDLAAQARSGLVIGTSGLSAEQMASLERAARHTALVVAPNTSLGVNLLFALTERVAKTLDPDYDIEIVEIHHRHKVDAPSGTALGLGRAAAAGRGISLEGAQVLSRDGHVGPRERGAIGFAALRGGDIVGDHTVVFAGAGERLELTHRAASRGIYARGALAAARWLHRADPGLYNMMDVLGL